MQKLLMGLLVALSCCTTALVALAILRSRAANASHAAPVPLVVVAQTEAPATQPAGPAGSDDAAAADAPPPVLFNAPAFNLTEASGKPLALGDLRGKVWIADFIFTHCGSICPRMTAVMGLIQERRRDRPHWDQVRLVSFSVDPEHDTPEVLREYAKQWGAQADHWFFLTGQRKAIWPMVRNGFKLPVEDATADADSTSPILHSGKFVLVDRAGRIRGYYNGMTHDGQDALLAALDRVLAEPTPKDAVSPQTQPATPGTATPETATPPSPAAR